MNKEAIGKKVYDAVLPLVEGEGYELVDVEFIKENGEWYLRIYIDKEDGIGIEDCTKISRLLDEKIDELDPIDVRYYFEVSSAGIERPLKKDKDFERFKGKRIKVSLYESLNERKNYEGVLLGLLDGKILLMLDDQSTIEIERNKAKSINLKEA